VIRSRVGRAPPASRQGTSITRRHRSRRRPAAPRRHQRARTQAARRTHTASRIQRLARNTDRNGARTRWPPSDRTGNHSGWCVCGSRRWTIASCASACAGGCIWCGCAPRLRTRIFGLLTQWGLRVSLKRLRQPDAMELLASRGVPAAWCASIREALAVIDLLDAHAAPFERELRALAAADRRVTLLRTIPGAGDQGRLTHAALGRRRGRPPILATDQRLAHALQRHHQRAGKTPPNRPSRARSSSPPGTCSHASSHSSPRARTPTTPPPSRQAPAGFWPPDGPASN
jgi:hypothetical protein